MAEPTIDMRPEACLVGETDGVFAVWSITFNDFKRGIRVALVPYPVLRTDGGKCFKGRICKEVFYLGKRFERNTSFAWFERRRPYERRGGGAFFDLDIVDEAKHTAP